MAENTDSADTPESLGLGMRLSIAGIRKKFPSVRNITTQALAALRSKAGRNDTNEGTKVDSKLLILDARPEEEYRVSHIPEARRVDYEADGEDIIHAIPEILTPEVKTTVVCYCSVGYRSSMVAEKIEKQLKNKGLLDKDTVEVYNLEGSLFKWANENRPMVDINNKTTIYSHPYNVVFGKLLNKELRKSTLD